MDNFDYKKYLAEGKLLKEDIDKIQIDGDEVTIYGFGENYTATMDNPEDPNTDLLFLHFFEDGEYHNEEEAPKLFKYLKSIGGGLEVGDDEASIVISLDKLNKGEKFVDDPTEIKPSEEDEDVILLAKLKDLEAQGHIKIDK